PAAQAGPARGLTTAAGPDAPEGPYPPITRSAGEPKWLTPVGNPYGRSRPRRRRRRARWARGTEPRLGSRKGWWMADHAVVVAGAGPTGLMLAGELALAGVDVAIVERRASQDLPGARAVCTHPPSRCSTSAASPIGSCRRGRW